MPLYVISCALRTAHHDYKDLWHALETAGAKRAMEAVWLMDSPRELNELTKALLAFLAKDDRLLIAEIGRWSATRLLDDTGTWLKERKP